MPSEDMQAPLTANPNTQAPCRHPNWLKQLQGYSKFIAAILGAILTSGVQLFPEEISQILTIVTSVATAIAVYCVENEISV